MAGVNSQSDSLQNLGLKLRRWSGFILLWDVISNKWSGSDRVEVLPPFLYLQFGSMQTTPFCLLKIQTDYFLLQAIKAECFLSFGGKNGSRPFGSTRVLNLRDFSYLTFILSINKKHLEQQNFQDDGSDRKTLVRFHEPLTSCWPIGSVLWRNLMDPPADGQQSG